MNFTHYADGVHWHFPMYFPPNQVPPLNTKVDERAAWFRKANSTPESRRTMVSSNDSVYLICCFDNVGDVFEGVNTYRLRVPPKMPVKESWSLTVYDMDSRYIIQIKEMLADGSSPQSLMTNADGSIDLYVGPKAPTGFEKNWILSVPGRMWFSSFCLSVPMEEHFNRIWILPDFGRVK